MFLSKILRPISLAIFVALLLAPVIGFSHALVPHTHTHTHDEALHMDIWAGLHGTLSRKDMVLPAIFFPLLLLVVVLYVSFGCSRTRHFSHPLGSVLRRGILPHRKFG